MTRNPFSDNTTLWAPALNAMTNGISREAIVDGCTPSKGTGDWDVDIASGSVFVSGGASVSSQTVDLMDPTSDLSAGEERIVLVTINGSGTASATEGTAATDPASPDTPADEVLAAVVHVEASDSTIADSDLFDYRVIDAHPHVEAKETPGTAQEESVTWTDAFSSVPIVTVSVLSDEATVRNAMVRSRSTTGATLRDDIDSRVKMAIARGST